MNVLFIHRNLLKGTKTVIRKTGDIFFLHPRLCWMKEIIVFYALVCHPTAVSLWLCYKVGKKSSYRQYLIVKCALFLFRCRIFRHPVRTQELAPPLHRLQPMPRSRSRLIGSFGWRRRKTDRSRRTKSLMLKRNNKLTNSTRLVRPNYWYV